ncbi:divergent polysaccharide deacetylase family protein [Rhizobium sp. G21]|uniref:divergent polysaccharide deacetylase family protein n=1 Tax=Rhizobium sp. G21 TaxID=2758439 RepID=UPI0015FF8344|nr:divergent polysaccharide deacetylase family protein [Rhizobium sp. G21]MBB1249712.1 divergent polysaccharide deacetylase family protein [Rhizobium sp. G21]
MTSGLHSPLGKGRKPKTEKRPRFAWGSVSAFSAVALIFGGLVAYPYLSPDPLQKPVSVADEPTGLADDVAPTAPADPNGIKPSRPSDGADVVRQVMPDGSVVTKYTPRASAENGPKLIDATATGPQSPDLAAFPDEALIENTPDGKLPIVAADGTRPFDRYARPWSGARGTRIAIVVAGLGLSQTGTQKALQALPEEITLAFAANGNSLSRWAPEARRTGHEILLQAPMEPFDYPDNDPGPLTLTHDQSEARNLDLLHQGMGKMTNYTGVMNYLGGRFLSDAEASEPVMRDIARRGLMFLDDGTSTQSLSPVYAKAYGMPLAFADLVLDQEVNHGAILAKLDDLERIALRKGSAIGVASAFDDSVAAIAEWSREAGRRGIEIVGVSALATVPN